MRQFIPMNFRTVLLAFMLGAVAFMGSRTFAQTEAAAPERPKPEGVMSLVLNNIDFVFVIIGVLSVVSLTLIIQGFIRARASVLMPEDTVNTIRDMISQRKFKELIEFTENDPSFIGKALNPALKRAPSFSSMKEAMETSLGEQTAEQFRKIEPLNVIGNLGPLLGLLGTTLGMIEAFGAMKAAGGAANPADLAGGISKALAHTFLGLFLAVPSLGAYGVLRTMVDRLTVRAALVSEELLLMIKPAEAKPAATPVPARPAVQPQPARKPTTPASAPTA